MLLLLLPPLLRLLLLLVLVFVFVLVRVVALVVVVEASRVEVDAVAVVVVVVFARNFVSGGHRRRCAFVQTRRDNPCGLATRSRCIGGAPWRHRGRARPPFCKWPDESERVEHVKGVGPGHELEAVLRAPRASRSKRSWRRGSS